MEDVEQPLGEHMPWYPEMRRQLVRTARTLADPEYQQRVWVRREMPPGIDVDSFDQAVHFIYDDTCLGENATEGIGWYVRNEAEAVAINRLVETLEELFDALGMNATDAQYLASKQWSNVVAAAKQLCEILGWEQNDAI